MVLVPEDQLKLLQAILVGGIIGAEREFRDKAAGFRTNIFICLGATLFTVLSLRMGGADSGTRIAANILTGVGFLGAGAIFRGASGLIGLTTASTIWLDAALGMGIGAGQYWLAGAGTVAGLTVLLLFPRLERRIDSLRTAVPYEVECSLDPVKFAEIDALIRQSGLQVRRCTRARSSAGLTCTWVLAGPPSQYEQLVEKLLFHPDVTACRV
jgi:putative Mg2+ transporter-C (MgtC) family protein